MAEKEDFHITLLKYGRERVNGSEPVYYPDAKAYVKSKHPELSDMSFRNAFTVAFVASELPEDGQRHQAMALRLESYFQLLEYEELQEARKSSRNALRVAIGAICISGGLAIASILLSLGVIPSSNVVTIEEAQVIEIEGFIERQNAELER